MKTYMAKPGQVEQQWWLVDATDHVVGRLAAKVATILMGKHRPTYTPHVDTGDFVVVTNVEKVRFTGNKWQTKIYQRYSGYPGGLREETAAQLQRRKPEEILRQAVKRMLPKSNLGRKMLAKLKLYDGPKHPHQAQQPQPLEL
jgi:large subunit ribosomal protein L13